MHPPHFPVHAFVRIFTSGRTLPSTSDSISASSDLLLMNLFNRIFTIIGLASLLLLGAALLIAPAELLGLMHVAADAARIYVFGSAPDLTRLIVRLLAALLWIAAVGGLLWLEVRKRPTVMLSVIRRDGGAVIQVAARTVEMRIHEAIDALPGVIAAHATARPRSKGVEITVDVRATFATDPVARAAEAADVVRTIVQSEFGLRLAGDPQISVRTASGIAKVDRKPSFFERLQRKREVVQEPPVETLPDSMPNQDAA